MSEFEFINRLKTLIKPSTGLYPNALNFDDDICIIGIIDNQTLIASQDSICENIHFFSEDPLDLIVKKAIRTNISDIAAKGATPYGMMFSICLPKRYHNETSQTLIYEALKEDLAYYNIPLLGGDTTSGESLTISITIFGLCKHKIPYRKNVQLNDKIYVTGTLGLAKIGLDLRLNVPEALAINNDLHIYQQAYLLPNPPLYVGIALASYMNAAMDISDGLIGDLQKMLHASNKEFGFDIDEATIPRANIYNDEYALKSALYGGDDYQILFTSNQDTLTLLEIATKHKIKLSCIGSINNNKINEFYYSFSHL